MPFRLRLTVGRKLALSFAVLGVFLLLVIAAGLSGMGKMSTAHQAVVAGAVPKELAAGAARAAASDMHFSQTEYALDGGASRSNFEADRAAFQATMTKLSSHSAEAADRTAFGKISAAAAKFESGDVRLFAAVRAHDRAQVTKLVTGAQNDASDGLVEALTAYQKEAQGDEQLQSQHFASVRSSARLLMIVLALVAALVGGALVYVLVRSITRAVRQILVAAEGIAQGDLEQHTEIRSRDELGAMATAFEAMIAYLKTMAAAAERIAGGDLSAQVEAKGPGDALGNAFVTMAGNLRELVGSVAVSAETLSSSSQQMAATSDETGRAVGEIAAAVTEVAQGAERQVRLVESTRSAVQEVARAAASSAETASVTEQAVEDARRVAREGVQTAEHASEAIEQVAVSSQASVALGVGGEKLVVSAHRAA